MTKDAIQNAVAQTPFRPFALWFTDGSLLPVLHPEFIHLMPNGRTVVISGEDGDIGKIVDASLITALDFEAVAKRSNT